MLDELIGLVETKAKSPKSTKSHVNPLVTGSKRKSTAPTTNGGGGFKAVRLPIALMMILEAAAKRDHRTTPQQIEHWCLVGMGVEMNISIAEVMALKVKAVNGSNPISVSEASAMFDPRTMRGQSAKVAKKLLESETPTYGALPGNPDHVIQYLKGKEVVGKHIEGNFVQSLISHRKKSNATTKPVTPLSGNQKGG